MTKQDGFLHTYNDLPQSVQKHLSTLEDMICDLDGKTLASPTGEDSFIDEGTICAGDYVEAFNGIVDALRCLPAPPAEEQKR